MTLRLLHWSKLMWTNFTVTLFINLTFFLSSIIIDSHLYYRCFLAIQMTLKSMNTGVQSSTFHSTSMTKSLRIWQLLQIKDSCKLQEYYWHTSGAPNATCSSASPKTKHASRIITVQISRGRNKNTTTYVLCLIVHCSTEYMFSIAL